MSRLSVMLPAAAMLFAGVMTASTVQAAPAAGVPRGPQGRGGPRRAVSPK